MKKGQVEIFWLSVIFFVLLIGFLVWAFNIVDYNEYCVEKEFGHLKPEVKTQGIRWVGIGRLQCVNNQVRNYEIKVDGASNDFQDVLVTLNLNIRINKDKVFDFVKDYKTEDKFTQYLNNKVQEKVKLILLKYSAEDLLLKREQVRDEMYKAVIKIPELKYFTFNDITIKNVEFSEEFNKMLERRAGINQEKIIIEKQKENLKLLKENIKELDISDYFKYKLIEKWDGKADLIISDAILTKQD